MMSFRSLALTLVIGALLSGCQSAGPVVEIAPGETPDINTDEAGLWMSMERAEEAIATSGRVVEDPALSGYVRDIVCRLAGEHCADLRIYILRDASFNAAAGPNGALYVHSGLLLRAETESQLAYVLGHEVAHYRQRHSLLRWRETRSATDSLVALQVVTAAAQVATGVYMPIGEAMTISMYGSIFAFSRGQERVADDLGLAMAVAAGYEPQDAARIWEGLAAEREASDDPDGPIFFATHPALDDRITALDALAEAAGPVQFADDRHHGETAEFRAEWLRDELRRRDFEATQVLLDRLAEAGNRDGLIEYFRGELHRLRGDDGDDELAIVAYRRALQWGGAPTEIYRSLGTVYYAAGRRPEARQAFERYVEINPNAEDYEMIHYYIDQLT